MRITIRSSHLVAQIAAGAAIVLLVCAATAAAAALFKPGATYAGRSATCSGSSGPSAVSGTVCEFRFRANNAGTSLTPANATVLASWGCYGGGGEAQLGGHAKYADPIPVITVSASRALHGSATRGKVKVTVTGTLSNNGRAATIVFHLNSGHCRTQAEHLTRH